MDLWKTASTLLPSRSHRVLARARLRRGEHREVGHCASRGRRAAATSPFGTERGTYPLATVLDQVVGREAGAIAEAERQALYQAREGRADD